MSKRTVYDADGQPIEREPNDDESDEAPGYDDTTVREHRRRTLKAFRAARDEAGEHDSGPQQQPDEDQ